MMSPDLRQASLSKCFQGVHIKCVKLSPFHDAVTNALKFHVGHRSQDNLLGIICFWGNVSDGIDALHVLLHFLQLYNSIAVTIHQFEESGPDCTGSLEMWLELLQTESSICRQIHFCEGVWQRRATGTQWMCPGNCCLNF